MPAYLPPPKKETLQKQKSNKEKKYKSTFNQGIDLWVSRGNKTKKHTNTQTQKKTKTNTLNFVSP